MKKRILSKNKIKSGYVNRQSTENPIVDWIVVKVASLLLKPLSLTNITPNMVTFFSFFLGITASVLLALSIYPMLVVLLFFLSFVFDRVDGGLARIKGITSKIGDFSDSLFDRIIDAMLIFGICYNIGGMWMTGFILLFGVYMTFTMGVTILSGNSKESMDNTKNLTNQSGFLRFLIIGRGTRIFALFFFLAINNLSLMILLLAIIQNLYWLTASFVYFVKLRKKAIEK